MTNDRRQKGLSQTLIKKISSQKNEPSWLLDIRLNAFDQFKSMSLPSWGPDLSALKLDDIYYYLKPLGKQQTSWDEVPKDIKQTFEKLGLPQHEREFFAGVGAQFESEMVYHNLKEEWASKGIIFINTDKAVHKHEDLFKQYFGSIVPTSDNKFAALNTAAWSGGSFIYVPKGVHITMPLQTYFRIEAEQMGQFERTLIIVDEGATLHYLEGCTAPWNSHASLHSGVVEIIAKKGSRVRYSTIQNWSKNIFNLVTQRAIAYENATVEWIDGNIGSGVTMKYPAVHLKEPGAKAEIISIALANSPGQIQDSGGKVIHLAPHTTSKIISKSISNRGGRASYRGVVKVIPGAHGCKSFVQCDGLILDDKSRSDAYPYIDIANDDTHIGHEARVSNIEDEQMFYLMSRGLSKTDAQTMIVNGFIEPFTKELPAEYSIEIARLIEIEMEQS